MIKITESTSLYQHLERMSALELVTNINSEDKKVALAVELLLPKIAVVVDVIADQMMAGGRLFYVGAGTSGRIGVLDASECPPTFGIAEDVVIGVIAGGDTAVRKAVEFSEDDAQKAWSDLQHYQIKENDFVIGIAASGTTPYVLGALEQCKKYQIKTACITSNFDTPIAAASMYPLELNVGPEFVTGSSRMKSGTAQKMILNMISTAVMIKLGRVEGNSMVHMQLSNDKLKDRGTKMVMEACKITYEQASQLLEKYGSVKLAIVNASASPEI